MQYCKSELCSWFEDHEHLKAEGLVLFYSLRSILPTKLWCDWHLPRVTCSLVAHQGKGQSRQPLTQGWWDFFKQSRGCCNVQRLLRAVYRAMPRSWSSALGEFAVSHVLSQHTWAFLSSSSLSLHCSLVKELLFCQGSQAGYGGLHLWTSRIRIPVQTSSREGFRFRDGFIL